MKIRVFVIGELIKSVHAFLDGQEYTFLIPRFPKKKYPVSIIKKKGIKFGKERTEKDILERIKKLKTFRGNSNHTLYYEQEK